MTVTLDRVYREKTAEFGARGWADIQPSHSVSASDAPSWQLAYDHAGDPVGFAGLCTFGEETTGTVGPIGVLPERRGRGHVDQLLRAVNLAARAWHKWYYRRAN